MSSSHRSAIRTEPFGTAHFHLRRAACFANSKPEAAESASLNQLTYLNIQLNTCYRHPCQQKSQCPAPHPPATDSSTLPAISSGSAATPAPPWPTFSPTPTST